MKNSYDKLLVVAAACILAFSCTWFSQQQSGLRRLRALPVGPRLAGALFAPHSLDLPRPTKAVWAEPPAQSRGGGWRYELFTPPAIYYNAPAKTFTVAPPGNQTVADVAFGFELLAVKPELYRLQVAGYFGGPGNYVAALVSPGRPDLLLGREGDRFDSLGLTLRSFVVKKVPVPHAESWPVFDVAAFAVLRDERTGADVVLDNRARKFTTTPLAILKLFPGDRKPRELHEGDTLGDDRPPYRVEHIQLDPPEVVITRLVPGLSVPETRVLHPDSKTGGQVTAMSGRQFSDRPNTAVVTNAK